MEGVIGVEVGGLLGEIVEFVVGVSGHFSVDGASKDVFTGGVAEFLGVMGCSEGVRTAINVVGLGDC